MPPAQTANFDEIARKWRDLADRRLEYFITLYQSGRWKHYYTREDFTLRMVDVIRAAKAWSQLADRTTADGTVTPDDHLRPAA